MYGNETITAYRDTAKNLSNFLEQRYPEIKEVRDITPEHIQAWIDSRAENWTEKTLENHLCRIKYLEQQAQRAYGKDNVKFYDKSIQRPVTKESTRNKAMDRDDLNRLREEMKESKSFAKDALEISARCGLRIDEIAHLRAEDIDLKNKTLFVQREGAKNGKERTVPIRDKDIQYFKSLKERSPEKGYLTTIHAKSIDKTIRRYMSKTIDNKGQLLSEKYQKTTNHAIRKMYATERMNDLRGSEPLKDRKEEMKNWNQVSKELGHGEGRTALYNTYCKS